MLYYSTRVWRCDLFGQQNRHSGTSFKLIQFKINTFPRGKRSGIFSDGLENNFPGLLFAASNAEKTSL